MSTAVLFPGQGGRADGMEEPWRGSRAFEAGLALDYDPFGRLDEGTRPSSPRSSCAAWPPGRPVTGAARGRGPPTRWASTPHLLAAGALRFRDGLLLVDVRADAMAKASVRRPSGMVAMLRADAADVARLGAECRAHVANDNAPGQVVVAGTKEALAEVERRADEIGARPRALDVSGAFHTPLMAPAATALADAIGTVEVGLPAFPVISTAPPRRSRSIRTSWSPTCCAPCASARRCSHWPTVGSEMFCEEVGPGSVLTGLVKRTVQRAAGIGVSGIGGAPARPGHHQSRSRRPPRHERRVDRPADRHPPPAGGCARART